MLQAKTHHSIGELCDEFAVTARALRFYEDEELIAPERRGTQRLYTDRDHTYVNLFRTFEPRGWTCEIGSSGGKVSAHAPSAPHAICRAALGWERVL